ncbi:hypothetical protein E4T56_gene13945 [Termitomyces sp. T112]|nr:hypothetical protein E4T56_gene13945 [Termitomyces sp. T112]
MNTTKPDVSSISHQMITLRDVISVLVTLIYSDFVHSPFPSLLRRVKLLELLLESALLLSFYLHGFAGIDSLILGTGQVTVHLHLVSVRAENARDAVRQHHHYLYTRCSHHNKNKSQHLVQIKFSNNKILCFQRTSRLLRRTVRKASILHYPPPQAILNLKSRSSLIQRTKGSCNCDFDNLKQHCHERSNTLTLSIRTQTFTQKHTNIYPEAHKPLPISLACPM